MPSNLQKHQCMLGFLHTPSLKVLPAQCGVMFPLASVWNFVHLTCWCTKHQLLCAHKALIQKSHSALALPSLSHKHVKNVINFHLLRAWDFLNTHILGTRDLGRIFCYHTCLTGGSWCPSLLFEVIYCLCTSIYLQRIGFRSCGKFRVKQEVLNFSSNRRTLEWLTCYR